MELPYNRWENASSKHHVLLSKTASTRNGFYVVESLAKRFPYSGVLPVTQPRSYLALILEEGKISFLQWSDTEWVHQGHLMLRSSWPWFYVRYFCLWLGSSYLFVFCFYFCFWFSFERDKENEVGWVRWWEGSGRTCGKVRMKMQGIIKVVIVYFFKKVLKSTQIFEKYTDYLPEPSNWNTGSWCNYQEFLLTSDKSHCV